MPHPTTILALPAARRRARGFTLIEVLVALVVMAFGLLGIAALLMVTLRSNTSSIMKQQAVQAAYNAVDRVRANRTVAVAAAYNVDNRVTSGTPTYPAVPGVDCNTASCTSTQVATYDTWYWLARDVARLPLGCGAITTQASGNNTLLTVTVQWDDSLAQTRLGAATSSPAAKPSLAQLVVTTLI